MGDVRGGRPCVTNEPQRTSAGRLVNRRTSQRTSGKQQDKAIEKKFINLKILGNIKKQNKTAITKKKTKRKE